MEELKVRLPSGALRVKDACCPNGHSTLSATHTMEGKPAIALKVRFAGKTGTLYLNSYYGKFDYECDLPLKQGDVVELLCPTCNVSLMVEDDCAACGISMFALNLPGGGQVTACPKVGCREHRLTIVDLDAQLAQFYDDETRFQM